MALLLVHTAHRQQPLEPERLAKRLLDEDEGLVREPADTPDEAIHLEWCGTPFVTVLVGPEQVRIEHVGGGSDQLTVLHSVVDLLRDEGFVQFREPGVPGVQLRYGADRRSRLEDEAPPALRQLLHATRTDLVRFVDGPPLDPASARTLLASVGLPPEPFLAAEVAYGGVEIAGLKVGLAVARDQLANATVRGAVPIAASGAGVPETLFWMDTEGIVFDDTDGERTIPIGQGLVELFAYWLVVLQGNRWRGTVHGYVCTVPGLDAQQLADRVGATHRFGWGPDCAVWPAAASRFCERNDLDHACFDGSATLSAPSNAALAEALAALLDADAGLRVRLDSPEQAALPRHSGESMRRLPAVDRNGRHRPLGLLRDGACWRLVAHDPVGG